MFPTAVFQIFIHIYIYFAVHVAFFCSFATGGFAVQPLVHRDGLGAAIVPRALGNSGDWRGTVVLCLDRLFLGTLSHPG